MKIQAIDDQVVITEVYNSITLQTKEGKQLHICMRDYGFEMKLDDGEWHMITEESDFKQKLNTGTGEPNTDNMEFKTNTASHAILELSVLAKTVPDAIVTPFADEIIALCEKFGSSGQSGGSEPYTASAISEAVKKLLLQQPICDITGDESEWSDVSGYMGGEPMWQNIRDSRIFKDANGDCTFNSAIVWQGEDDWDTFIGTMFGIRSSLKIKSFPFKPQTFYIDVRREPYDPSVHGSNTTNVISCGPGDMIYFLKDESQLEKVWEVYENYNPKLD